MAEELKFDEALERLEKIVADLEDGKLSLEDSIAAFEEGMKLHKFCSAKLAETKRKIEVLVKNEENVLGTVLSGAGPSILVISKDENLDNIYQTIKDTWQNLNVKVDIFTIEPELQGACIVD